MHQTIDSHKYYIHDEEGRHVLTLNQRSVHFLLQDIKWTRDEEGYIRILEASGIEMGVNNRGVIAEIFVYPGYILREEEKS
ncbi:hypothetical protein QE320_gp108 [Pseudomonas phage EM]|uniref:Uncharacterized protein n=1 Tax=Pseudomonas phage EM TaxID=2936914 RepID=A0AAE9KU90_9CAUD|nr:hypothetical protein QE320_gp108 [Pseudomonas phage EM]UPW35946.1 hypothetical protein EM_161 [Pseudomonas phage EM]